MARPPLAIASRWWTYVARFPGRQAIEVPAQRDSLVQLRQLRIEEQLPQLRLPDQDDAEQLARRGLEVEQQPDLLQQLDREALRFVQHDDARSPGSTLRNQVGVQRIDEIGVALARHGDAELPADPAQQVERRERRREGVGSGHVGAELAQEHAEQGRLAGTHVTGDADEPARLGEPEPQVRERLGVLAREKQVARIGRQPERLVLQPEELLVHPRHLRRG